MTPTTCVLTRIGKDMDIISGWPCKDRGRHWSNGAINQETLRITRSHRKVRREKEGFWSRQVEHGLANTVILAF